MHKFFENLITKETVFIVLQRLQHAKTIFIELFNKILSLAVLSFSSVLLNTLICQKNYYRKSYVH